MSYTKKENKNHAPIAKKAHKDYTSYSKNRKPKAKVEFGVKLDISVCDGWTRLERYSFDAYNESTVLKNMIEEYKKHIGHYQKRVLADKIYRNRENLSYCKQHNIKLSGSSLGRPKKDTDIDRKQNYIDEWSVYRWNVSSVSLNASTVWI